MPKEILSQVKGNNGEHMLGIFSFHGYINLIKLFSYCLIAKRKKLFKAWISQNILILAAHSQTVNVVRELWNFAEKLFDLEEIRKLLIDLDLEERNVLHYALINQNDGNVFKFFLEKVQVLLRAEELERFCFSQSPLWSFKELNFTQVLSRCVANLDKEKIQTCLKSADRRGLTVLSFACQSNFDNKSFSILLKTLKKELTTSDLQQMVLKANIGGATCLMLASRHQSQVIFQKLSQFLSENFIGSQNQLLLQEDKNGLNVLNYSSLNEHKETFNHVKKLYEQNFGAEKIQEIISKSSKLATARKT